MESEIKIITDLAVERWEEFKNLRVEAQTNDPNAFSSEIVETLKQSESDWRAKLEGKSGNKWVFAECNGKLIGMGFINFYQKLRFKHNVSLQGLYVTPEYRGKGIGEMLITARIEIISQNPGIKNILCDTYGTQVASIELHKKLGFEIAGCVKDFVVVDGKYYDLFQFVKRIR